MLSHLCWHKVETENTNATEPGKDDLGVKKIMWCDIPHHLGPLSECVCVWDRERDTCRFTLDAWVIIWIFSMCFLFLRLSVLPAVALHPLVNHCTCTRTHTQISCLNGHTYAQQHLGSRWLRGHAVKVWVSVSLFLFTCNCHFLTYGFYCTPSTKKRDLFLNFLLRDSFHYFLYVQRLLVPPPFLSGELGLGLKLLLLWSYRTHWGIKCVVRIYKKHDVTWLDSPVGVVMSVWENRCLFVKQHNWH